MPPLRGLIILRMTHYKDTAPTALKRVEESIGSHGNQDFKGIGRWLRCQGNGPGGFIQGKIFADDALQRYRAYGAEAGGRVNRHPRKSGF
jgi:hypothetical protein